MTYAMAREAGVRSASDPCWHAVERPLARLRAAIEEAEAELTNLRRAYARLAELSSGQRAPEYEKGKLAPLSVQENRVAHLLEQGQADLDIASTLHVSVNTVKTQVKSILRKLGLRSRWEVARAIRERQDTGLVSRLSIDATSAYRSLTFK